MNTKRWDEFTPNERMVIHAALTLLPHRHDHYKEEMLAELVKKYTMRTGQEQQEEYANELSKEDQ